MCAVFVRESVVTDSDSLYLLGLSDLAIRTVGARVFIYASGEYEGGLNSFEMLQDGSIVPVQAIGYWRGSGTHTVADLDLFGVGASRFLLPSGRYASAAATYRLQDDGTFAAGLISGGGAAAFSHFSTTDSVILGSKTYVYASRFGEPGLQWFAVSATGGLVRKGGLADTAKTFLRDVTDIEVATLFGKKFLFTASGTEPGVQSHSFGTNGALRYIDREGPAGKWGFNAPNVLESAQIGNKAYLIMGAGESGTLTVFSVSAKGMLTPVDHLIDTRDTRFDGIQALTKFETAGRVFLVAGGSDDGITLLQLLPNGHLSVIVTLADDWDTTLDNVSSIQVAFLRGQWTVLVGSASEHGFTTFALDLGDLGAVIQGTELNNILTGTLQDNDIYGNGGDDALDGGDGNDRLSDGTGIDRMTGGPGADVFDFADDGAPDTILDFELGIDRIDLSSFALIYHVSELVIQARDYGFDIVLGDDLIRVETADALLAEPFEFSQTDFIFG